MKNYVSLAIAEQTGIYLVNRKKYLIPPLNSEERQRLADYFADDVRATVEMFPEIDISFWSDFID
jgi:hypothetical protein